MEFGALTFSENGLSIPGTQNMGGPLKKGHQWASSSPTDSFLGPRCTVEAWVQKHLVLIGELGEVVDWNSASGIPDLEQDSFLTR